MQVKIIGQNFATNRIHSNNSSRSKHSNNGQSIVINSIQSNNFLGDNQMNDHMINITIGTLAVQTDAIWQIINTLLNFGHFLSNTIPTLIIETNGRNIATNSIHDQSNNFTGNENTRARPIHLSRTIIPDDPESDHLINENTENYYNNDNTQSLEDIDEIGLGVILNIRVEDVDFS